MLVSWNNHFTVGIDVIDAGHGLVIEAINLLNDATTPADSRKVTERMLPLLVQQLGEQFREETQLLAGAAADVRDQHEAEHRRMLEVLEVMQRTHRDGGDASGPLLLNLVCFLVSHLRATDGDSYAPNRFHKVAA